MDEKKICFEFQKGFKRESHFQFQTDCQSGVETRDQSGIVYHAAKSLYLYVES